MNSVTDSPAAEQANEATAATPLVEAKDVHKAYTMGHRTLEVLRGVSVTLHTGELLALRGASGAGKSTLLHLIGGLDSPNQGEIWFHGQNLAKLSDANLARWRNKKAGFIFQAYHLFPELDATENVALPARMARVAPKDAYKRAVELLDRVGLKDRLTHRPSELSGGEQQRVAIARALINSPDLILADEPTGNLDSQTGEEIIELLWDLRKENQTGLIIATHDAELAKRVPKTLHLIDGQIDSPATE